jgi:hypothetical protein
MDPNELIKAAPAIAKGAGALAAAIPFTAIVKKMLGAAADELAEMWRDQVRMYRYERQLKCVEKAEKMAQDAGFTPQAVPPKILFPLLEGASMEEDENLHDMWAALLANAASPGCMENVRPGFIGTLRQMAPDEAALLAWMHERTWSSEGDTTFTLQMLFKTYDTFGFLASTTVAPTDARENLKGGLRLGACVDSLEAARLIRSEGDYEKRVYKLTTRGDQFIYVCRPPKPKK